jgi:hypothetical protein
VEEVQGEATEPTRRRGFISIVVGAGTGGGGGHVAPTLRGPGSRHRGFVSEESRPELEGDADGQNSGPTSTIKHHDMHKRREKIWGHLF